MAANSAVADNFKPSFRMLRYNSVVMLTLRWSTALVMHIVKGEFFPVHAMKAYVEVEVSSTTKQAWLFSFSHCALYHGGVGEAPPGHITNRKMDGLQKLSGCYGIQRIKSLLPTSSQVTVPTEPFRLHHAIHNLPKFLVLTLTVSVSKWTRRHFSSCSSSNVELKSTRYFTLFCVTFPRLLPYNGCFSGSKYLYFLEN